MKRKKPYWLVAFAVLCAFIALFAYHLHVFPGGDVIVLKLRGKSTVSDRLSQYGPTARARLQPDFERERLAYPPAKLVLVGLKAEKRLEVYAGDATGKMHFIRRYPVLAASGKPGPKLRMGDMQVPEGFYRVESLNPNSAFHLALRVSYPNAFDRRHAAREGRTELGGDIMIHGSNASAGCLAMGDEVAEDLFVLAADTGVENVRIILSPVDFRDSEPHISSMQPPWTKDLYRRIKATLLTLPKRAL